MASSDDTVPVGLNPERMRTLARLHEEGHLHVGSMLTPEECSAIIDLMRDVAVSTTAEVGTLSISKRPVQQGKNVLRAKEGLLVLQEGQTLYYFVAGSEHPFIVFAPGSDEYAVRGPAVVPLPPYQETYLDAGTTTSMIVIDSVSGKPLCIHNRSLLLPNGNIVGFSRGSCHVMTGDTIGAENVPNVRHLLSLPSKVAALEFKPLG